MGRTQGPRTTLIDQLLEHHKSKFQSRIADDSVSPKEFSRWMLLHMNGACVPDCLFCEIDNESVRFVLNQANATAEGRE